VDARCVAKVAPKTGRRLGDGPRNDSRFNQSIDGKTDFMRSLQVPPRAPKKKSRSKDLLFLFYEAGLEKAAPVRRLVQKLRAGEQFLARGKVLLFRSTVRKDCETK